MSTRSDSDRFDLGRRRVLTGGLAAVSCFSLFGGPLSAATRLVRARTDDGGEENLLVVLQLAGGNDGLNTIVPYADDRYYAARSVLRVAAETVLPIDDYRGFNPLLAGLRRVYDRGELAIVEGVGYPNPNRSHFTSFDIWHTASERGRNGGYGWLARTADALRKRSVDATDLAVHIGDRPPYSLYLPGSPCVCFRDPAVYRWDHNEAAIFDTVENGAMAGDSKIAPVGETFVQARHSSATVREATEQYQPRVEYPRTELGNALQVTAALIQGNVGARIFSVELAGFDTHAGQPARHEMLLRQADGAIAAFLDDLRGTPRGDRTTLLVFSEFGRRVAENASKGTDHGAAGPLFVAGTRVKGGLYGAHPSLEDLDEGDLRFAVDFRSVYATLAKHWFGLDDARLLGQSYETLPLLA